MEPKIELTEYQSDMLTRILDGVFSKVYQCLDWEKHTCGECGYFWCTMNKRVTEVRSQPDTTGSSMTTSLVMDASGCGPYPQRPTQPHTEACPAFIQRPTPEKETDD